MKNYEVAHYFESLYDKVQELAPDATLFQDEAIGTMAAMQRNFTSLDELLGIAHDADRLVSIHAARLGDSKAFKDEWKKTKALSWREFEEPPVPQAKQDALVGKLYYQRPIQADDKAVFVFGEKGRYVGRRLVERALEDGLPFELIFISDDNFNRLVLKHCAPEDRPHLANEYLQKFEGATKRMSCGSDSPTIPLIDRDEEAQKGYSRLTKSVMDRIVGGTIDYCLTSIPTEKDAEIEGMTYPELLDLFFDSIDQPEEWIGDAHRHIIGKFDKGDVLHITTPEGTDLHLRFRDDDGTQMTCADSRTLRNVPGYEFFTAPIRDSLGGTLAAKGRFQYVKGKIVRDLTLHFEKGKIVAFEAAEGGQYFQEFLDRDPGNYYTGEFGKGTNPHLRHHMLNGLLVEKIGTSFHLALGRAYTATHYLGAPVNFDNGNRSIDHWDITTMLGVGARMTLDDEIIMENGRWVDPALSVLNDGWAVVPVEQRPERWKNFQGYGAVTNVQPCAPMPVL